MTNQDILKYQSFLVLGFVCISFTIGFVAEVLLPGTMLAASASRLFQWSTWAMALFAPVAIGGLAIWAGLQVVSGSNIIFMDGERHVIERHHANQIVDFRQIVLSNNALPEPRYDPLNWLDAEIDEVLSNKESGNGEFPTGSA